MFANSLFKLYKYKRRSLRSLILRLVEKLEGGQLYSQTLRRIFCTYHGVEIGMYTIGGCFDPGAFDRQTKIGRYCSIARGARGMNRNHPMEFKSTHAFFFNPKLGRCAEDRIPHTPLEIGNDVWIGANALILPQTKSIGDGAVIAAGAVVGRAIPPYAIAAGNPARVVRFRFPPDVIEKLLASRWWEQPIEKLDLDEFTRPYLTNMPPIRNAPEANSLPVSPGE